MKKCLLIVALSLLLAGCGEAITPMATPAQQGSPTRALLVPTVTPSQLEALIPSAASLSHLFSARDGKVTDVNVTHPNGTTGVGLDIQVYNPTQTKVKHLNYLLMRYFFGGQTSVTILSIDFHADGYTGGDDPIASISGLASEYHLADDENSLWDAMSGAFNADLPA